MTEEADPAPGASRFLPHDFIADPNRPDALRNRMIYGMWLLIAGTALAGLPLGVWNWDHAREFWEFFVPTEFAILAAISGHLFPQN